MLLFRCSLLADSISRSISFWPSTMATRSSSACVALNSIRFMFVSRRENQRGSGGGAAGGAGSAPDSTGGGQAQQRRTKPRGQRRRLPCYEGSDAGIVHRGRTARQLPAGPVSRAKILFFALSL